MTVSFDFFFSFRKRHGRPYRTSRAQNKKMCTTSFILCWMCGDMREYRRYKRRSHKYHQSIVTKVKKKMPFKKAAGRRRRKKKLAHKQQSLNGASGSIVADTLVTYRSMPLPPPSPPALTFSHFFVFACARAVVWFFPPHLVYIKIDYAIFVWMCDWDCLHFSSFVILTGSTTIFVTVHASWFLCECVRVVRSRS